MSPPLLTPTVIVPTPHPLSNQTDGSPTTDSPPSSAPSASTTPSDPAPSSVTNDSANSSPPSTTPDTGPGMLPDIPLPPETLALPTSRTAYWKVMVSAAARLKINFIMHAAKNTEIGWLGWTPRHPLMLEDIMILPQECSYSYTEFDDFYFALWAEKMKAAGFQRWQWLSIWGHTHPNMSADPSGTDWTTIHRLATHHPVVMFISSKSNPVDYTAHMVAPWGEDGLLPNMAVGSKMLIDMEPEGAGDLQDYNWIDFDWWRKEVALRVKPRAWQSNYAYTSYSKNGGGSEDTDPFVQKGGSDTATVIATSGTTTTNPTTGLKATKKKKAIEEDSIFSFPVEDISWLTKPPPPKGSPAWVAGVLYFCATHQKAYRHAAWLFHNKFDNEQQRLVVEDLKEHLLGDAINPNKEMLSTFLPVNPTPNRKKGIPG